MLMYYDLLTKIVSVIADVQNIYRTYVFIESLQKSIVFLQNGHEPIVLGTV